MKELSKEGLNLIISFEGLRLTAYKAISTEKYYTIGYGHYGSDVTKGMRITKGEAERILVQDCQKFVSHVNSYDKKYNFTQNQFDALVSFAFNVGSITQLTQGGTRTISQISEAILLYNKSGGKVLKGLTNRRKKEKQLFDKVTNLNIIAKQVIEGKWGNGITRVKRLTDNGYDYIKVQKLVNEILKGES